MLRVIAGVLLMAHGFVHARVWMPGYSAAAPKSAPDPGHSWMLGEMRTLAVALRVVAAAGFMVAGLGLLTDQAWWTSMTIAAGAVSLVLIGLTFNVWLSLGAVVSAAALVYAATQASA